MVVLLMLIPLLAPSESGAPTGLKTIARALGIAALKVSAEESNISCYRSVVNPSSIAGPHVREIVNLDATTDVVPLMLVCYFNKFMAGRCVFPSEELPAPHETYAPVYANLCS